MKFIKSIFFVFLVAIACAVNTDNLVALVQLFRHGERTPIEFYKNDPFKDHWGDLGTGQLTNEGRRQLYVLGQYTRQRYSQWLPQKYNKIFFRAETTDVDRTHISGQSYLYGLFPAIDDQIWLENVNWQAIPLHPADPKIVAFTFTTCLQVLHQNLLATDEFVKINKENADLYAYLSKNTGNNVSDIYSIISIYDALYIENSAGLDIPKWTQKVFPDPMKDLYAFYFKTLTYTAQLKRIYVGTFLNEIVEYFKKMAADASSAPKFQVYCAHDNNVAAILDSFASFEPPYPPEFGSTIWLELRKTINDIPYVNVWSKNGDNVTQISINGCDLDCPLYDVKSKLKEILVDVDTVDKECSSIIRKH